MTDEKLMRYLDGELTPAESREVERELAAAPEMQTKRDALLEMRDILRARYEIAESEAEPQLSTMWERLRSALPAPSVATVKPSVWLRLRDWFEAYRSHFVTGVTAAAAGAILATVVTSRIAGTVAVDGPDTSEVESLEVLNGSGMVFHEPPSGKDEGGATVIWVSVNDPDDDDDGSPEPGGPI